MHHGLQPHALPTKLQIQVWSPLRFVLRSSLTIASRACTGSLLDTSGYPATSTRPGDELWAWEESNLRTTVLQTASLPSHHAQSGVDGTRTRAKYIARQRASLPRDEVPCPVVFYTTGSDPVHP